MEFGSLLLLRALRHWMTPNSPATATVTLIVTANLEPGDVRVFRLRESKVHVRISLNTIVSMSSRDLTTAKDLGTTLRSRNYTTRDDIVNSSPPSHE
jgi:hypothetical protein